MIILHRRNHCTYYVLGDEKVPRELEGLFSDFNHLTKLVESLGYKYSRRLSLLLGEVVYQRR